MDAVQSRGGNGITRRFAIGAATLTAVGVLAGGAGGYLFRGTATIAVHQTTSAGSRAPVHAAALPRAGNPPRIAANADSQSGYGSTASSNSPTHAANSDSQSGYGSTVRTNPAVRAPNADSQSGY